MFSSILKRIIKVSEIDAPNPLTLDTTQFIINVGKGIIKIGKELL